MQAILTLSLVLGPLAAFGTATDLPRSSPESQGVSSGGVLAFVEAANEQLDSLHSFMLLRHGHVVAEGWWAPYTPNAARPVLTEQELHFDGRWTGHRRGEAELDDPVLKFFPDDAPAGGEQPTSRRCECAICSA